MNTQQKSHVEGLGFSSSHLFSPLELVDRVPRTASASNTVEEARETIHKILRGEDDRLIVIAGPVRFMMRRQRWIMLKSCAGLEIYWVTRFTSS